MALSRKKKLINRLSSSFGKMKTESFNFDLIERYCTKKSNEDVYQVLSDKTCNDLDFHELFMLLDRTNSKIGQQFLFNRLKTIPQESSTLEKEEEFINQVTQNSEQRISIQKQIDKLNHSDAYYIASLFQDKHPRPPSWFFIIPLLSAFNFILIIASFFYPQVLLVMVVSITVSVGFHYWNKVNIYQYLVSIPQLLIMNKVAKELFKNKQLAQFSPNLRKPLEILNGLRVRISFFSLEANIGSEMSTLIWATSELIKTLFLIEPILLYGILKRLDQKRDDIEEVFAFIGKIDSLISIASLRAGQSNYCIPSITNENSILVDGIYHPLIQNCITNSIRIDKKSILLTGSNMSGKTTFIRTIAINTITALTLNTCFAKRFSIPRVKIFSAIRISDDLMNDKSYYFAEVLTIKEMIDASKAPENHLFLLDEIYKGTNTIERIAAGKAILSNIASNNNFVFVSTHDIELADLLQDDYELYHFSEKVGNSSVDFDYKLKVGKLKNRNAIKILQLNNYPEKVIEEAMKIAKELDNKTKLNNS